MSQRWRGWRAPSSMAPAIPTAITPAIRAVRRACANEKEGRLYASRGQDIQDLLRPSRRPIVEGEDNVPVRNARAGRRGMSRVDNGTAVQNRGRDLPGLRLRGRVTRTFPDLAVDEPSQQQEEQHQDR